MSAIVDLPSRPAHGLPWVLATGGSLSLSDVLQTLPSMGVWLLGYAHGLIRLTVGPIPESTRVDVTSLPQPKNAVLASECIAACQDQPCALTQHCWRTYYIGMALANIDKRWLDPDLFFAASLLHDYGLAHPSHVGDFTLDSAACAIRCARSAGLTVEETETLTDAICSHATIGISPEKDGPLGCYVQWGAMADLAGMRRWELGRHNLEELGHRHGYTPNYKQDCIDLVSAEADRFKSGRFAFYRRLGISFLIRLAPLFP